MATLLDTGILLRLVNQSDPNHRLATDAVNQLHAQSEPLVITTQNFAEFWAVATRPTTAGGLGIETAQVFDQFRFVILPNCGVLPELPDTFDEFLRLAGTYEVKGKKIHDVRLVAIMQSHQVSSVLTFNDRDFQRFSAEGIRALHPSAVLTSNPLIGLLGGIASGKSFVARSLVKRGAILLDADKAGHEVLREPDVKAAAVARWGESILGPDGEISRQALASIVFAPSPSGPSELAALEAISHPRIESHLRKQIAQLTADGKPHLLVLDAPVMLKAGWNRLCSLLIFVEADRVTRLRRAMARGWTEAEFDAREAAQEPLEFKRKMADVVIDNSGSAIETEAQIDQIWANHFANHHD